MLDGPKHHQHQHQQQPQHFGNSPTHRRPASRWCDPPQPSLSVNITAGGGGGLLAAPQHPNAASLAVQHSALQAVCSAEQCERLAAAGVHSVAEIMQLTVAQLNQIGLSIAQIHEIQLAAAMGVQRLALQTPQPQPTMATMQTTTGHGQDLDMRMLGAAVTTAPPDAEAAVKGGSGVDVDMRVTPTATATLTASGGLDYSQYLKEATMGGVEPSAIATGGAFADGGAATVEAMRMEEELRMPAAQEETKAVQTLETLLVSGDLFVFIIAISSQAYLQIGVIMIIVDEVIHHPNNLY